MTRDEFCERLAEGLALGGVIYPPENDVETAEYQGDGLIAVVLESGERFNVNVTTAR